MKMEYSVQVLRGWPNEGALDRVEVIKSGSTLSNGDWVVKQSDNTVDRATTTKTNKAGLVIRGNGDSGSAAYTSKAVVLWSNFIVQAKNLPVGVTFTPGANLTIQWNSSTSSPAYLQLDAGTDPVIGYVLDVIAASSTNDASVIAVIR
jgi:hypothetical protein